MSRNTTSHPGLCERDPAPRLHRCRAETLRENRTFGMWAGVWLDHDLPTKRHLLQPDTRLRSITAPAHTHTTRVGSLAINQLSSTAAAMVTARASRHCQILGPACLLHQELIFTRQNHAAATPIGSPAPGLAACHNCAELIEQTQPNAALQYGYITTSRHPMTSWPVYRRQRRWVVLKHFGQLINLPSDPPASGRLRRSA